MIVAGRKQTTRSGNGEDDPEGAEREEEEGRLQYVLYESTEDRLRGTRCSRTPCFASSQLVCADTTSNA